MLEDHARLVYLLKEAGEIVGRKKLQKIMYIMKKCQFPFQEKYHFHVFGPYSEELTLRMEELCNLDFIEEQREDKGGYHQYRYTLKTEGETFLSHQNMKLPPMGSLVDQLNSMNSKFLELVATILYFDDMPRESIIEKVLVVKQKQHYSLEDLEEAFEFIKKIPVSRHIS
jgi:uncharacterized protein YwgA